MKQTRKLLSILLALAMVCALATTAFAEEANLTGHSFTAYQIFSGTQAEGTEQLGNIEWGAGINSEDFLAALKADSTFNGAFENCDTAAKVADAMKSWTDGSAKAMAFARLAYAHKTADGISVTPGTTPGNAGYYLIVDTTNFGADATNTVYNLALLQLTNNDTFDIAVKTDVPEVQKKVKDINDSTETALGEWKDSADHDVGDVIPFQLTATLPSDLAHYKTYKLVFHDTGCAGLTVDESSFEVKVGDTVLDASKYAVSLTGNNFTVTIDDVIALGGTAGGTVTVEYNATLNSNAVIGSTGNPNKVYLEYSNNPNYTGDGSPDTGKTPEDVVIVFTYKVVVNKVDKDKKPLAGATFTLSKYNLKENKWDVVGAVAATEVKDEAGEKVVSYTSTFERIDDGKYKLEETVTPAGYNTIAPIEFTVEAGHIDGDTPALQTLTGGDIFKGTVSTGALTGEIENNQGSTLPETGGIGTTIFYTLGGVLVMVAVVLLVTKKRMNGAEV